MEFFVSDARKSYLPLSSAVPTELELVQKLEDDKLESGRKHYDFNYLSCFKKWLTEDETVLIDQRVRFIEISQPQIYVVNGVCKSLKRGSVLHKS